MHWDDTQFNSIVMKQNIVNQFNNTTNKDVSCRRPRGNLITRSTFTHSTGKKVVVFTAI